MDICSEIEWYKGKISNHPILSYPILCYAVNLPILDLLHHHTQTILSAAHITLFLSHHVRTVRAVHNTVPYESCASFNIASSDQPSSLLFLCSGSTSMARSSLYYRCWREQRSDNMSLCSDVLFSTVTYLHIIHFLLLMSLSSFLLF